MNNILLIILTVLGFILGYSFRFFVLQEEHDEKLILKNFLVNRKDIVINVFYGLITSILSFYISYKVIFENNSSILIKILILLTIFIIIYGLLYLSFFDFEYYEIPDIFSLAIFLILAILNIVLFLFGVQSIELWNNNVYLPGENLLAGFLGGAFIFIIVALTKGKGMGSGDIRIAAILGLSLGMDKLLAGFYITIISASIIGIIYSIKLRKFHGVQIPFVPFIVFGTIIAFLFSHDLINWFLSFYGV